jgi:hypothetical protein
MAPGTLMLKVGAVINCTPTFLKTSTQKLNYNYKEFFMIKT